MNIKPKTLCKNCRFMAKMYEIPICLVQPINADYSPIDGKNRNADEYVFCHNTKSFNEDGICTFYKEEVFDNDEICLKDNLFFKLWRRIFSFKNKC